VALAGQLSDAGYWPAARILVEAWLEIIQKAQEDAARLVESMGNSRQSSIGQDTPASTLPDLAPYEPEPDNWITLPWIVGEDDSSVVTLPWIIQPDGER